MRSALRRGTSRSWLKLPVRVSARLQTLKSRSSAVFKLRSSRAVYHSAGCSDRARRYTNRAGLAGLFRVRGRYALSNRSPGSPAYESNGIVASWNRRCMESGYQLFPSGCSPPSGFIEALYPVFESTGHGAGPVFAPPTTARAPAPLKIEGRLAVESLPQL